jgi:hypothetical protein
MRPLFLLTLAAVLSLGCRGKPQAADPDRAREALRQALDAWQKGESPESLKGRSPSLTVADSRWAKGYRLLSYKLADKDQPSGYDLQMSATLVLQDPSGKESQEKALYSVSTHPSLVVVRTEGS